MCYPIQPRSFATIFNELIPRTLYYDKHYILTNTSHCILLTIHQVFFSEIRPQECQIIKLLIQSQLPTLVFLRYTLLFFQFLYCTSTFLKFYTMPLNLSDSNTSKSVTNFKFFIMHFPSHLLNHSLNFPSNPLYWYKILYFCIFHFFFFIFSSFLTFPSSIPSSPSCPLHHHQHYHLSYFFLKKKRPNKLTKLTTAAAPPPPPHHCRRPPPHHCSTTNTAPHPLLSVLFLF